MRLQKVAALCTQTGMFYLFDQTDDNGEIVCQWLGDAEAFYPIAGLPYMDTDNICAMFDIPEKKQEKLTFRHTHVPGDINWEDTDTAEFLIADPKLCVPWRTGVAAAAHVGGDHVHPEEIPFSDGQSGLYAPV